MVSIASTQVCCFTMKAVIADMGVTELQKQAMGWICSQAGACQPLFIEYLLCDEWALC